MSGGKGSNLIRNASNYWGVVNDSISNKVIADGYTFTYRQILTIPSGVSNIYFDSTSITDKFTSVYPPNFVAFGGDKVKIEYYVGAGYTLGGGSETFGANRNELIGTPSQTKIIVGATPGAAGTKAPIEWLLPGSAQGNVVAPGGAKSDFPFILNPATIKRLLITNSDGASQDLEVNLAWNEIPFTALP